MLIGPRQDAHSPCGEARMNFPSNSEIYWLLLNSYEWIAITRLIKSRLTKCAPDLGRAPGQAGGTAASRRAAFPVFGNCNFLRKNTMAKIVTTLGPKSSAELGMI